MYSTNTYPIQYLDTGEYKMNTSTKYTVSDAAVLYKKSRATLYKDIKNGVLSRDSDGLIDFSELLRVYGEPFKNTASKRINMYSVQHENTVEYRSEYTENTVNELKNQVQFLKQLLERAEDREAKANQRIDTLLTLIELKSPVEKSSATSSDEVEILSQTVDPTVTADKIVNKRIPVPEPVVEEVPQRGFLSRFFKPYG